MLLSYWWILEEKRKSASFGNTCCQTLTASLKRAHQKFQFPHQVRSGFFPWLGTLQFKDSMPAFFSTVPEHRVWWWRQVPICSSPRHWIFIRSSQISTFLLVQTRHFILIEVMVQNKIFMFHLKVWEAGGNPTSFQEIRKSLFLKTRLFNN